MQDRTADGTASWFRNHPEAEVVSRDRCGLYAKGAREGAPQAKQCADRFHILQNLRQAVENQLNQLLDMAKHGITITDQLFGTVASDITTLRQIVNTGQSLSYTLANMDGTFRLRFPGYSTSTNYGQSYQTWSQTSLDSTLGALKAAGVQNDQFDSDEALLQSLQGQSQSAVGRMQAIEVGNQIAENQAEQLMKLRQLMMADLQSKAAYQSTMVQAQATKQANSDQFFGQTQVTSDGVTF